MGALLSSVGAPDSSVDTGLRVLRVLPAGPSTSCRVLTEVVLAMYRGAWCSLTGAAVTDTQVSPPGCDGSGPSAQASAVNGIIVWGEQPD